MKVILGKDVYMLINGQKFICAENVELTYHVETKSVKTRTSGHYKSNRGQAVGFDLSVNGLLPYDFEDDAVTAMDLIFYAEEMVAVQFAMIFDDENGDSKYKISGEAVITELGLTGPADFAGASISFVGNEKPLRTSGAACAKAVTTATVTKFLGSLWYIEITGVESGPVARYDYRVDGGGIKTSFLGEWSFGITEPLDRMHSIEVWAVCDNGEYGERKVINFPGVGTTLNCDSLIYEAGVNLHSGIRTVTIYNSFNADSYIWAYRVGASTYTGTSDADTFDITDHGAGRLDITPVCSNDVEGDKITLAITTGQAPACDIEITSASHAIIDGVRKITVNTVDNGPLVKLDWAMDVDDAFDFASYTGSLQVFSGSITSFGINTTKPGVLRIIPYCGLTANKGQAYYLVIK